MLEELCWVAWFFRAIRRLYESTSLCRWSSYSIEFRAWLVDESLRWLSLLTLLPSASPAGVSPLLALSIILCLLSFRTYAYDLNSLIGGCLCLADSLALESREGPSLGAIVRRDLELTLKLLSTCYLRSTFDTGVAAYIYCYRELDLCILKGSSLFYVAESFLTLE